MSNPDEQQSKSTDSNSQTATNVKIDRRHQNKRPPNSGRKPKEANLIARGIKKYLDDHFNEKVKIQITDPQTGKTRIIEKPRIIRVLEKLYEIGVQNDNADALNKWLDRALGRPIQTIAGEDNKPILVKIVQYDEPGNNSSV